MIDTVRLTQPIMMPEPNTLLHLGFLPCWDHQTGIKQPSKWVLNSLPRPYPRFTWRVAPNGLHHLSAEASLPKLHYGSNVYEFENDDEIERALASLSCIVSDVARVNFCASNANVGRVDFCYQWRFKQQRQVYPYIRALQDVTLPRLTRRIVGDTTVEFFNKSQKVSVYSKLEEVVNRLQEGNETDEALNAAIGIVRLEKRYWNGRACQRLAKSLQRSGRLATDLLNMQTGNMILERTIRDLGLDRPINSIDCREALLREFYGPGQHYIRLLGFLAACDTHGAGNVITMGIVSRSDYYCKVRELKDAGVLVTTPSKRALPPLRLLYPKEMHSIEVCGA